MVQINQLTSDGKVEPENSKKVVNLLPPSSCALSLTVDSFSVKTARWCRTLENLVSKPASEVGGFGIFSSSPKSLTCEAGFESQIFLSPSPVSSLCD